MSDHIDMRARLEGIQQTDHECDVCKAETLWRRPYDGRWFCTRCGTREFDQEASVALPPGRQVLLIATIRLVIAGMVLGVLLFGGLAIYLAVR